MAYDFSKIKAAVSATEKWLADELSSVRTGRATPTLLDAIQVEVYGSRMSLIEVASITVEDVRSLYVAPWDKSQIKPIEKAITVADLGVGVGSDDKGVRVSFPELTAERRQQLVKIVRGKLEDARVTLRGERSRTMDDIDGKKKDGAMGEDDAHRAKDEVQKIIDAGNAALEALVEKKEKELNG